MKVAVIGAGFSGLAIAYHLLELGVEEVAIFDGKGIGNGASGVAAGLLHPYVGAHAKKNRHADQAMAATERLLIAAEKSMGAPVCKKSGLLRLVTTDAQLADFKKCAELNPDVTWITQNECGKLVKGVAPLHGIFIENGYVVDCQSYLNGLWKVCEQKGASFVEQTIASLKELDRFDHIVAAMGAATSSLSELSHLKIEPVKGQVLEFDWADAVPPLPFPLSSQVYLLNGPQEKKWIGGATFEHRFKSPEPDQDEAIRQIIPKLRAFYPDIDQAKISGCRAGVRASTAGHVPMSGRIGERLWVLTGMGSKGLLYHALYADALAKQITKDLSDLKDLKDSRD